MPDISEVSKNAKKIKEQIAEKAGVAPKEINDSTLQEVGKAMEGAAKVASTGQDPTAVPIGQLKETATGEKDATPAKDSSNQHKIAMAIAAIAPALIGYAAGGSEGGAIGAQVGQGAIKQYSDQQMAADKDAREFAQKKELKSQELSAKSEENKLNREKDLQIAKERAEDRRMMMAGQGESRQLSNEMRRAQLQKMQDEAALKKSAEGKLAKLNSGDKARLDNTKLGLEYTQAMDAALSSGDNTVSVIGDNKFTNSLALAAEAFGRMQSGGAINKEEEARFIKMSPRPTDSVQIQRMKLQNMQKLFADRMDTLGFTPDELGLQVKPLTYGANQKASAGLNNEANAAPAAPDFDNMSEEELKKYLGK